MKADFANGSRIHRIFLGAVFFSSGALALIYELIWHRQFSLLFGSSAPAAAAVLAAYFSGLGIGSYAGGRWSHRWPDALRAYGMLELAVAAGALDVTPLLAVAAFIYPALAGKLENSPSAFLGIKAVLAFLTVLVPTVAMGATLPVLAGLVDARKEQPGRRIGWLYAINTAGAALGTLAFPFVLLPAFGLRTTTWLCAGLNLSIGTLCILISRNSPASKASPAPTVSRRRVTPLAAPLLLAFLSGAGAFALQIVWNRAFAQVHENSIFSFAQITFVFIVAIAAGAALARWILIREIDERKALGAFWLAGGALVLISPVIFVKATNGLEFFASGHSHRLIFLTAAVIFVPITLLGAGMPLLFENAVRSSAHAASHRTGSILAWNICGAVSGALLAGFLLPGFAGMWKTASGAGLLFMLAAVAISFRSVQGRIVSASIVLVVGWIAITHELPRVRLDPRAGERLLALAENAHGTVAVVERGPFRRLKLNNHYVLGGSAATGDERMQAHLPLLLHPQPRSAVFLGYGTGITAGAALLHPQLNPTAIELVSTVATFAAKYFAQANLGFAAHERAQLIIDDARNFLRASAKKYDVIVGDLVVPWRPGEAGLYSRENFAAAKAALNNSGVVCVWVPAFQVTEMEFQIILNTFLAEFGRATLWRGDFSPADSAIALVATTTPLDPATVATRLAQLMPDNFNPQLKFPAAFWMHFIGAAEAGGSRINSENRPWVELRLSSGGSREMFTGRRLQTWETRTAAGSEALRSTLSPEANAGWEAGRLMREFALLFQENRRAEAAHAQAQIRQLLGPEISTAIFGPN